MTAFKSAHLLDDQYQFLPQMMSSELGQGLAMIEDVIHRGNADEKRAMLAQIDTMMTSMTGGDGKPADRHIIAPAKGEQSAVDLYVFYPDNQQGKPLPVVYFAHGGGLIVGNANQQNPALKELANACGVAVVSVEYALAPSRPHPADMLDAYHGLSYVFDNADEFGFDKDNVIIMGESGGGAVATRLALYNGALGKYTPKGLVLIYPMLDHRTGGDDDPYANAFAGEFLWTRTLNQLGWTTSQGGQDLSDEQMRFFSPAVVPDVSGLPPTFIIVGALDLFVDESVAFAGRLICQGVPTELHVLQGVPHAFELLNPQSCLTHEFYRLRNQAISAMIAR